jgi:hypothetical protein
MPYLSKLVLASLTFVILCLGMALTARADTFAFTGSFQDFNNPPAAPNIGRCGAFPPNLLVNLNPGTGTSNLGAFTTTGSFCTDVITSVQSNGLFSFDFTSGLASGSTLFGTQSGTTDTVVNGFATNFFTFSITGGTGLFAGATGTLSGPGTVTFLEGGSTNGTGTLTGTITTVPEPATMLLLGTGLAGLGGMIKRKRQGKE